MDGGKAKYFFTGNLFSQTLNEGGATSGGTE